MHQIIMVFHDFVTFNLNAYTFPHQEKERATSIIMRIFTKNTFFHLEFLLPLYFSSYSDIAFPICSPYIILFYHATAYDLIPKNVSEFLHKPKKVRELNETK